jgi:hypothetical protein
VGSRFTVRPRAEIQPLRPRAGILQGERGRVGVSAVAAGLAGGRAGARGGGTGAAVRGTAGERAHLPREHLHAGRDGAGGGGAVDGGEHPHLGRKQGLPVPQQKRPLSAYLPFLPAQTAAAFEGVLQGSPGVEGAAEGGTRRTGAARALPAAGHPTGQQLDRERRLPAQAEGVML